jgi:hypothetical protein
MANPLGHESLHFRYDYVLLQGGALHELNFIIDGTHMAMGVVRVIYVEYSSRTSP